MTHLQRCTYSQCVRRRPISVTADLVCRSLSMLFYNFRSALGSEEKTRKFAWILLFSVRSVWTFVLLFFGLFWVSRLVPHINCYFWCLLEKSRNSSNPCVKRHNPLILHRHKTWTCNLRPYAIETASNWSGKEKWQKCWRFLQVFTAGTDTKPNEREKYERRKRKVYFDQDNKAWERKNFTELSKFVCNFIHQWWRNLAQLSKAHFLRGRLNDLHS